MIKVYASIGPCEPIEEHEADGITVGQWMAGQTAAYKPGDHQPVSISVNGELLAPSKWAKTLITSADDVAVRVQPAGVELLVAG